VWKFTRQSTVPISRSSFSHDYNLQNAFGTEDGILDKLCCITVKEILSFWIINFSAIPQAMGLMGTFRKALGCK